MATEAQIAANRRNAQKSTGPKTRQGIEATKMNALRHGLYAKTSVLPFEDPADLAEVRQILRADLQPRSPLELSLFKDVVVSAWRLQRARDVQFDREQYRDAALRQEDRFSKAYRRARDRFNQARAGCALNGANCTTDLESIS